MATEKVAASDHARKTPPGLVKPFHVRNETELDTLPQRAMQIARMLSLGDVGVFVGPPGSAKSLLLLDLVFCVALGRDWHGHEVKQGRGVLAIGEGAAGVQSRKRAWKRVHGITKRAEVDFVRRPVNLLDGADVEAFAESITVSGPPPALIGFDTYSLMLGGADENASGVANSALESCRSLNRYFGCATVLLHHPGSDERGRERGSSALRAGVDLMVRVGRNGSVITVGDRKFDKVRDFAPIEPFTCNLVSAADSIAIAPDDAALSLHDEVLNLVRASPGWSRLELRERLKRGKPAVYGVVAQLIERGALIESPTGLVVGTETGTDARAHFAESASQEQARNGS